MKRVDFEGGVTFVNFGLVFVTIGSESEARDLAKALVDLRLVACASITPVRSIYRWDKSVQDDREWQLILKTDLDCFDRLEKEVRSRHSYDVPEIVAIPFSACSDPYSQWLSECIGS